MVYSGNRRNWFMNKNLRSKISCYRLPSKSQNSVRLRGVGGASHNNIFHFQIATRSLVLIPKQQAGGKGVLGQHEGLFQMLYAVTIAAETLNLSPFEQRVPLNPVYTVL